jgi:hypothetical protein
MDHWEEAVGIGEEVGVPLVLVNTSAPEFSVVSAGDHSTFCIGTQSSLDVVKGFDHFVAYRCVQSVFFSAPKRDDKDLVTPFQRKVGECRDLDL